MARTGWSAGIKPINQLLNLEWEYARPTNFWAVPVLPATVKPAGAASLAVPPGWVTVSMIASICLGGLLGEYPPHRPGRILRHLFPLGAVDLFHQVRLHEHAVVAHGRQGHGHLQDGDGHALAEGQGSPVNGRAGPDQSFTRPAVSPGKRMPVRRPKPKSRR